MRREVWVWLWFWGLLEREWFSGQLEREFLHEAGERVCWRQGSEPRATRASETCTCRHELRAPRRRDTRGAVALRDDA